MKQLLAIAAIALFPLALTAQTQHFKFTNDGAFAAVAADLDANSNFRAQVSRSSDKTGTTTNLFFFSFVFAEDLSSATFVQIVGTIPNSSFTGDNTRDLVLDLDPGAVTGDNFFSQSCTLDFSSVDPIFSCGPTPAGTIHLAFHENGFERDRLLAREEVATFGTITIHTHQRADTSSAAVQGTIFGTAVSSSNATVGVNHMSTLEFTRN